MTETNRPLVGSANGQSQAKFSVTSDVVELAVRFSALFSGCGHAYGTYNAIELDTTRGDGKRKGQAFTKRGPVTHGLWEQHLLGKCGLGIIPVRDDSTVTFGAIDVDAYSDLNHAQLAQTIATRGYPLVVCRSKSGGAHLYCFAQEPVAAGDMQARLQDIAARLGCGTSEVFPKQCVIRADKQDLGSWLNMPYFDHAHTVRYAVSAAGDPLSAGEFLTAVNQIRKPSAWFADALAQTPTSIPDGPPCLQHLIDLGFPPGTWNSGMFALGVYLKKSHPDDWKGHLIQLNSRIFPADKWPVSDLDGVIKSLGKKEYFYQCGKAPLVEHCDRSTCRKRKFGIGGGSSLPVLSSLSKLMTDPPLWFLDIEGNRLELTTEELLNPITFQVQCANHEVIVPLVKRAVWTEHLRPAMQSVNRIPVADDDGSGVDDSSAKGHFRELLEMYCADRVQAHSFDETRGGKPFTDEDGITHFQLSGLMTFLVRKGFKDLKRNAIVAILKDLGGKNRQKMLSTGQNVRLWSMPAFERKEVAQDLSSGICDPGLF